MIDESKFQRMTDLTAKLNAGSDDLNARIVEVQDRINSIGPGVAVWLELQGIEGYLIGYGKMNGNWMLRARAGVDEVVVPLTSAPRIVRVHAIKALPEVVDAVIKRMEELIEAVKAS